MGGSIFATWSEEPIECSFWPFPQELAGVIPLHLYPPSKNGSQVLEKDSPES